MSQIVTLDPADRRPPKRVPAKSAASARQPAPARQAPTPKSAAAAKPRKAEASTGARSKGAADQPARAFRRPGWILPASFAAIVLCLGGAGAGYYVLTGEKPPGAGEDRPVRKASTIRIGPIAEMPDIRDGVPALMPAKPPRSASAAAPATPEPSPRAAPSSGGLLAPSLLGQDILGHSAAAGAPPMPPMSPPDKDVAAAANAKAMASVVASAALRPALPAPTVVEPAPPPPLALQPPAAIDARKPVADAPRPAEPRPVSPDAPATATAAAPTSTVRQIDLSKPDQTARTAEPPPASTTTSDAERRAVATAQPEPPRPVRQMQPVEPRPSQVAERPSAEPAPKVEPARGAMPVPEVAAATPAPAAPAPASPPPIRAASAPAEIPLPPVRPVLREPAPERLAADTAQGDRPVAQARSRTAAVPPSAPARPERRAGADRAAPIAPPATPPEQRTAQADETGDRSILGVPVPRFVPTGRDIRDAASSIADAVTNLPNHF